MRAAHADTGVRPTAMHPRRAAGDPWNRYVDVLIIGAGLSGIAAAYHVQTRCPGRSFLLLEARDTIGGTWDLFRYPGVRSDSDMYTLGFSFRPWQAEQSITSGQSILDYVRETAREYGIDGKIQYQHRVLRASWDSEEGAWTVEAEAGPARAIVRYGCNFLHFCGGYYDYDQGHMPGWPDMERFKGRIAHPQRWPDDLDYAGRRVVVIGSGATAVTLVPELAKKAGHVAMLQRSPTYVVARPAIDPIARRLRRWLPARLAHPLMRWKNVLLTIYFYGLSRRKPDLVKQRIVQMAKHQLGADYDVNRHFAPRYNPWDQRLCLAPDGDLFGALRAGTASVLTDEIERFTETGIALRSGGHVEADIIVTATGLAVKMLGGVQIFVDGRAVDLPKTLTYKGMMLSDVPNLAFALGYTNASWTLKCELVSAYVCRLLNYMEARSYVWCVPRRPQGDVQEECAITLTSGYVKRASSLLPKQGSRKPWRLHQNYLLDMIALKFGAVNDGTMAFGAPPGINSARPA